MSPPFAMWIESACLAPGRVARPAFEGVVLGRAPAIGDSLTYFAPLALPIPVHCAAVLGVPRGSERAQFGVAVREDLGGDLDAWVGGILVEAGVAVHFGAALLETPQRSGRYIARLEFGADHAWCIASISRRAVNVVVVGGGLPGATPWDGLVRLRLSDKTTIERGALRPLTDRTASVWRLPVITTYEREEQRAMVVRPIGIATRPSWVGVGDTWRRADVVQVSRGLTQFFVPIEPGPIAEDVTIPFFAAA